jgi:tetratricopeptide (TPR) repeat protein
MRGLHYVLTSAYNTRAIRKFNHHLEHLKAFEKERRDVFNDNSTIIAFLYIQTSSLNKHYLMGTFNEGVKEIPALLGKLNEYSNKMDIHRILVFYYKIAYMYIGNEDYDTALDYLNAILDLNAVDLREDIQNYAHLLSILAHFELGNYQLLEYLIGKVRKLLSKTKELNALQRKTFRFFNNIIRQPESEHMELFKKFREEIRKIEDDPLSIRDFIYLDVPAWIDSKIEKKSMSEIIKERLIKEGD